MTEAKDQTIRNALKNIYFNGNVTSLVALAYSSVYIWHNSYQVIDQNDPKLFRKYILLLLFSYFYRVATPSSFIGPGGRIYLTNEGICGMQVHIAHVYLYIIYLLLFILIRLL